MAPAAATALAFMTKLPLSLALLSKAARMAPPLVPQLVLNMELSVINRLEPCMATMAPPHWPALELAISEPPSIVIVLSSTANTAPPHSPAVVLVMMVPFVIVNVDAKHANAPPK
eukprot:1628549-Prymnesium_polylepis.2